MPVGDWGQIVFPMQALTWESVTRTTYQWALSWIRLILPFTTYGWKIYISGKVSHYKL